MHQRIKLYSMVRFLLINVLIIIILFSLLEGTLFTIGQYLLWDRRKTRIKVKDAIKIICIGDSHTYGVNVSRKHSYPIQLQTLLNKNNAPQKFIVKNLGVPSTDTKFHMETLKKYLDRKDADVVLLLTGMNNDLMDQYLEFDYSNEASNNEGQGQFLLFLRTEIHRLRRLRSVRFLSYLTEKAIPSENPPPQTAFRKTKAYDEQLTKYLKRCHTLCEDHDAILILSNYYFTFYRETNAIIQRYAVKNNLAFFEFTKDFELLFDKKGQEHFMVGGDDPSHMNRWGYKYYAEKMYEKLFLTQESLPFKLKPLTYTLDEEYFEKKKNYFIDWILR